jgi:hypothetical protein
MEFNETDPSVFSKDFKTQLANVKKGNYGWIGSLNFLIVSTIS